MSDAMPSPKRSFFERLVSTKDTGEPAQKDDLLDIRVHNPLRRVIELLKDLKRHQNTTVSLRFTIPLIALPVVLLAAFQLGRVETACVPAFTTLVGNLDIVRIKAPKNPPTLVGQIVGFFSQVPLITKPSDLVDTTRTVLLTQKDGTLTVVHAADIGTVPFDKRDVLITGYLNACTRTITLDDAKNLSLLNPFQ